MRLRHGQLLTLFVLGLSLGGCGTLSPVVETVLREEIAGHHLLVQLEAAKPGIPVQFAHPVMGEEQQLTERIDALLAELAYGRPKGRRLFHALEDEDRHRLATAIARGLTSAGPRERVRFLLRIEDDALTPWLTPRERLTRGIAFVDLDGRFNLAFDLLDDRVDPNELDPHDPTEAAQTRARLVSETGEDIGRADDGSPRLWVAWSLLPSAAPQSAADLPKANAAKLELLDELLRDGIIDREEYERRRARLDATDSSPE